MRVCGETHGSCGCVATVVSEDLSDYTQGKGAAEQFAQELHCKSMQLCPNEGSFAPKRRQQLCRVFVQLPDCNLLCVSRMTPGMRPLRLVSRQQSSLAS